MNLAQTDPYMISHAGRDGRLFLTRTSGQLSAGTRVRLISAPPERTGYYIVAGEVTVFDHARNRVRTVVEEICQNDDLVIRRRRS